MFTRTVITVLFCVGVMSLTQAAVKLADLVTPCSLKDPKLDDCLTTQGRALLPHLVKGVREWDILSLNPLLVPRIVLQKENAGSVALSLAINNSRHFGYSDIIIKEIKFDPKTYDIVAKWNFPAYVLAGEYDVKGKVLLLPIVGSGAGNITFVNMDVQMTIHSNVEERKGKKYLKVIDVKMVVVPRTLKYNFDDIFENKQLGDTIKQVLNENPLEVYEELRTSAESVFTDIIRSIVTRLFNKVSLDQLFKDVDL